MATGFCETIPGLTFRPHVTARQVSRLVRKGFPVLFQGGRAIAQEALLSQGALGLSWFMTIAPIGFRIRALYRFNLSALCFSGSRSCASHFPGVSSHDAPRSSRSFKATRNASTCFFGNIHPFDFRCQIARYFGRADLIRSLCWYVFPVTMTAFSENSSILICFMI